ncbi:MAG: SH3 domain-containing protein [Hyphomicrobiales bacterium]
MTRQSLHLGSESYRHLWVAAGVLAIAVLTPHDALACGRIQHWIAKYDRASSDAGRLTALAELSGNCAGYVAKQSDRTLLPIVADAVTRGIALQKVQRVFDNFRCLPGVKDTDRYAAVSGALDMSNCPTSKELKSWYVAVADGVIIRSRPSRSGRKLGWVMRGSVVKSVGGAGDWLEIADWHGQKGFIHQTLLQDYATYEPAD